MVKAIINVNEETNRVLNVLKAEYGLKDKSEAIDKMAHEFKRFVRVEPEIRPEYIKRLMKIQKQKRIRVGTLKDFRKRFGLE